MIIANELRIGNYLHDFNGRLVEVLSVKENNIRCVYNRIDTNDKHVSLYRNSELFPIPLTPELLNKIGKIVLVGDSTEIGWLIKDNLYFLSNFQLQKGLHWFQNYHYFRTEQELEYKP